ncbi:MAG: aldehyde dehydrogenase family protein [Balneolales bacterium]
MQFLESLGVSEDNHGTRTGHKSLGTSSHNRLPSVSPVDGNLIASVSQTTTKELDQVISRAREAFDYWRKVPAPKRGEIIRQAGHELRAHKENLGKLVSWECGKLYQEGLGEVQEMIDICDFAVGLSRQLYGVTMHSERQEHRMYEQYHPLGTVGVISAFNFPVAVWSWNAMVAAVCGDTIIWKPSEKTPLTALACQNIISHVLKRNDLPEGIFNLITGGRELGEQLVDDRRVALISATGSSRMGKAVGQRVTARLGKSLLELGGNNAIIISDKADLEMAIRATVFGAVGTAGQRCTSTRRLIVHEGVFDEVRSRLIRIYRKIQIGNPLQEGTLVGPLIDKGAVDTMQKSLSRLEAEGGKVLFGGEVLEGKGYENGLYVRPALCMAKNEYSVVQEETFAPILYLIPYTTLDEAIRLHNDVVQGLSSSIFTLDMREAETFLGATGSDCGIANVNIGTSGAEIGGAFGGEKETGGGRESGSDAWKAYMRRQTNTINWGEELPLAQGIRFDV